jgi:hypothetical protein
MRYYKLAIGIVAIAAAAAWYLASADDAHRDGPPPAGETSLEALEHHPDVVAWKAATGMGVIEAAMHHYTRSPRLARAAIPAYAGLDAARLRTLADAGDPRAAFVYAMNPRIAPDDAIPYLESAIIAGGYSAALFQIALQHERKAIEQHARPVMLRLRDDPAAALTPVDEQYLIWLHAAAALHDVLADRLLWRGLPSLRARPDLEERARRTLDALDRTRADRHLPALQRAPVTDAVRAYIDLRFPPRNP